MSERVATLKKPKAAASAAATPVRSMTGYGRGTAEKSQRVTAEIRAVNNRFLKLGVKLPGRYGSLEDRIKTLIAEHGIKRGSVDVSIWFEGASDEGCFGINETAVKNYLAQARSIAKKNKLKGDVPLAALLPLPEVVKRLEAEEDLEDVWALSREALLAAIADFNAMREKEGAAMAADLRSQTDKLIEHRAAILSAAPEVLKESIRRFKERIAKMLEQSGVSAPLNEGALEREVVMMTDRMDISEELARLNSHFEQFEATLAGGGEVGKKLDFLTQELFRETNTIGSKAQDERITHRVVDMKGAIEKIREQVQNLE